MSLDVKYRTSAITTGGREGRSHTDDGRLEVKLTTPKELGGPGGEGTNPEQLFAAGYSACFLSAMKAVSSQLGLKVPDDASIAASVGIGMRSEGGFGLEAALAITLPGLAEADARRLVDLAHQVCPYSNATRNNIDVRLAIA
ncbi:organic hydroperoxide resistance protein [uncultured Martelella sp.]|uniref:organic hydroperoxide resistance protein n=1 Tax=uncultured Martelella sp. TaxID=392331 RepID=UPI0029C729A1|nr:organic hydroperoxide resistance protein [uncultured Martelella sp.]